MLDYLIIIYLYIEIILFDTQIGCCGADGSYDYIQMRQPLPDTCRDTVTGNAFFNGCVDELTWLLEDKVGWVAGLAMTLALIQVKLSMFKLKSSRFTKISELGHTRKSHKATKLILLQNVTFSLQIINAVLSLVLVQALKKEEEVVRNYRH